MGRPKGSKNKRTLLKEAAEAGAVEQAADAVIEKAAEARSDKLPRAVADVVKGLERVKYEGQWWYLVRFSPSGKLALLKRYAYRHWDVDWVPAALVSRGI